MKASKSSQHVRIHYLERLINVLAPEHEFSSKIVTPEQKEAVDAYIAAVSTKSDLERTELSKEKQGIHWSICD